MKLILTFILTVYWLNNFAQTYIGGVLSNNTTLTLENSPYIVTNNLLVQQGIKVTIEPGVEFRFNDAIYFQVDGTISAIGTPRNPIKFTKNTTANDWGGIDFTDLSEDYDSTSGSGSIMSYCIIENTGFYGYRWYSLHTIMCSPLVSNCEFRS